MKITVKQLALSLYESVDGKPVGQVKVAIAKFVELLVKKNMLAKADKIVEQFVKIWNGKRGLLEASVTSANSLDKAGLKLLKDYIAGLSGAKEVILSEQTDKDILGGVVIRYGDKVVNGSLRANLEELRNNMAK